MKLNERVLSTAVDQVLKNKFGKSFDAFVNVRLNQIARPPDDVDPISDPERGFQKYCQLINEVIMEMNRTSMNKDMFKFCVYDIVV